MDGQPTREVRNRNSGLFGVGVGCGCLLVAVSAFADGWTIERLTNNNYPDLAPDVWGTSVVWCAQPSVGAGEIMLYDGRTVASLTNNAFEDAAPRISAGGVCWQGRTDGGDWEIYHYVPGSGVARITDNAFDDLSPKIAADRIVWHAPTGSSAASREIFLYDGSASQPVQLTNNSYADVYPAVSEDRLAWMGQAEKKWEIFLSDGHDPIRLTNNTVSDDSVCLGGAAVFWRQKPADNTVGRIMKHDGTGEISLTDNTPFCAFDPHSLTACASRAVWCGQNPETGVNDIFLYTGSEVLRLTRGAFDAAEPAISEEVVVWREFDGNDYEIFVYDGASILPLTNNDYDDLSPRVWGRTLAWVGMVGGADKGGEIFRARHAPEPSAAAALVFFGTGWLTQPSRLRRIRRSDADTHCRHG